MSHTIDWRDRGKLAVVQWCEGRFLAAEIPLLPGQSIICPECSGVLYHDGEFRTVVCTGAKPETVKQMFKQILSEELDD